MTIVQLYNYSVSYLNYNTLETIELEIKEVWIVNPDAKCVMIYHLEGVKYGKPEYLTENDTLESRALDGLEIDLSEVWA